MTVDLKSPLSTYFDATNAHEAGEVAALFGETARVHDEGQEHRGRMAIRDWAQSTYDRYGVRVMPIDARTDGKAVLVSATVTGTFPGSPINLQFRFVTDGDRIEDLTIG